MEGLQKKNLTQKLNQVLLHYSNVSTIPGIKIIFDTQSQRLGKIYWTIAILVLMLFGTYWSIEVYQAWQTHPVFTVVDSTAVPVEALPFPSLVLCIDKFPTRFFKSAIIRKVQEALIKANKTTSFLLTPIAMANKNLSGDVLMVDYTEDQRIESNNYELSFFKLGESFRKSFIKGYNFNTQHNIYTLEKTFKLFTTFDPKGEDYIYRILSYITCNTYIRSMYAFYLDSSFIKRIKLNSCGFKVPTNFPSSDIHLLNYTEVFQDMMSLLWYAKLPCFDIMNLTAFNENDSSFVKRCMWRGIYIPCAAIFTLYPTDQGLCCAFNTLNADKMFAGTVFKQTVSSLQAKDKRHAISNVSQPEAFASSAMLTSKSGMNSGLQLTLDGHMDLHSGLLISKSNFDSFTLSISQKGDFPVTSRDSIKILTGHRNLIALRGSITKTDDAARSITPNKRGCFFSDEFTLKLFVTYSETNCLFECGLINAQKQTQKETKSDSSCTPWFLPFIDSEQLTCDPYLSKTTLNAMSRRIPPKTCSYCLPDCNKIQYSHKLSMEVIRPCDDFSFRKSPMCNVSSRTSYDKPNKWSEEVLASLVSSCQLKPVYQKNITRNVRQARNQQIDCFGDPSFCGMDYVASKEDLTIVNIFYDSSTAVSFSTIISSTWIIYLSNCGGLYGLCLGFCISTVAELSWLLLQIIQLISIRIVK